MAMKQKDQDSILKKLGIKALNPMQVAAHEAISIESELVLLSPTGTGKTLAFLLPILSSIDKNIAGVQVLILVPSRELAIQIEQVAMDIGSGHRVKAVYGGRSGSKDKHEMKTLPALLVGTPGRVADHIRREVFDAGSVRVLVLDEFDKSLEVGFEEEMKEIIESLDFLDKKILTSATQKIDIPDFVQLNNHFVLDYLSEANDKLKLVCVKSKAKDKLESLLHLLCHLGDKTGIIFCNFRDSIDFVSLYLEENGIGHTCFHGKLEQRDRERALIKFRNGTTRVLVATDLAARGIDVPEMDYIIHYQIPNREDEFIHRNGRTARMHSEGTAYFLTHKDDKLHSFIRNYTVEEFGFGSKPIASKWITLFISGGKKDKISKGDIAGLFFKQGDLGKDELGLIELKQDCSFVAVPTYKSKALISKLNNVKLKKKKVRISIVE